MDTCSTNTCYEQLPRGLLSRLCFLPHFSTREWRRSGVEKPPRTAVAEARLQTKNYSEAGASPVPCYYFFFLAAFLAFFFVAIGIASLLNPLP